VIKPGIRCDDVDATAWGKIK